MKNLLEKISWLTRKWNFKFKLFELYLHDGFDSWGFEFFTIQWKYKTYSVLALLFRLPNMTNVRVFTVDSWDFLFLYKPLWNWCDRLSDKELWTGKLTKFETIILRLLNKIIR